MRSSLSPFLPFTLLLFGGCGARTSLADLEDESLENDSGTGTTDSATDTDVFDTSVDTLPDAEPPPLRGWSPIADPPTGFLGREAHVAVWTGSEMLIVAGVYDSAPAAYLRDGARYDRARNVWSRVPDMPLAARSNAAGVWTGKELFVWGGANATTAFADGATFDPATGAWSPLPAPPASFVQRTGASAGYFASTGEVVIWGGVARPNTVEVLPDGIAYNVASRTWRSIPASPLPARQFHATSASPSFLAIGFGFGRRAERWKDLGFFDVATDSWQVAAPAPLAGRIAPLSIVGDGIFIHGGAMGATGPTVDPYGDAAIFDRALGSWESVPEPTIGVNPHRFYSVGFYGGGRFHVWGGRRAGPTLLGDGLAYDRSTKTWSAMPMERAPEPRWKASVVWTGEEAIVWGGVRAKIPAPIANGAAYRP